jgi:2'-5' RNA ligase
MQHPFTHTILPQQHNENQSMVLQQYLLVLQLSPMLAQQIQTIKQQFATAYNCKQVLYSKPYITLVSFMQYGINNNKIIQHIANIAAITKPIHITIEGFASFPAHTIYANIATQNAIVQLVKALKVLQPFTSLHKFSKGHYITTPHISIARNLLPWQYEQAWLHYSHEHFVSGGMLQKVVLLQKAATKSSVYNILQTFSLQGKAVAYTQQQRLF